MAALSKLSTDLAHLSPGSRQPACRRRLPQGPAGRAAQSLRLPPSLPAPAHPPPPSDTPPHSRPTAKPHNPVPTRPGKSRFWLISDFRSIPSIGAVPALPGGLLSAVISLLR